MQLYHLIEPDSLGSILRSGLKRTSRGDKGDDKYIKKTDKFLDAHCPADLKSVGVSRDNNLYACLGDDSKIIDITDGRAIEIAELTKSSDDCLVRVYADPRRCYVSDLDIYDEIKYKISNDTVTAADAQKYWEAMRRLEGFAVGDIQRPEVMITCDIPPQNLQKI